jgi:radical SAM protein with 4Fe4S-binding SPASM domain
MESVVKTISLILTQNCNLSCTYCYEHNKSKREMSFDTAINIVERYVNDSSNDFDECIIDFYGGEPFLNFELMKKICEYVWTKKWKKPYSFFATTNGTLIHGEIRDWVLKNKEKFHLALSIDGTNEMQDINRSKSFSKIDLQFFKETWTDLEVKMTISKETLPSLAKGVTYLHSLGFKIRNNLAYGIDWFEPENIQILSNELKKMITYYLEHPKVKPCSLMDLKIEDIGYSEKKWCRIGTHMIVFDVDGKNYPCHGFLPTSIGKEKAENSRTFNFHLIENLLDLKCKECLLHNFCPTCYASNYKESNNMANRNPQHCNFNKVRALACSFLQAKKILMREQPCIVNKEDHSKIESIIQIQNKITVQLLEEIFLEPIFQLSELEIVKLTVMKSISTESESLQRTQL